jgi:hypothetical protein
VSALSGHRVEVFRAWGGTWTGTVIEHDCAGLLLMDPEPGFVGAMFIPWDKVQWVDLVDMPRGLGKKAAA